MGLKTVEASLWLALAVFGSLLGDAQASNFFRSPYHITDAVHGKMIMGGLFKANACGVDATCFSPELDPVMGAVVEIGHPVALNFCSGTLIRGPDGRHFILTANHCLSQQRDLFAFPISTYAVTFNYKVPCGANEVSNVAKAFPDYLQGLSLVYQNLEADVMILELLQDIPPHWNVSYAGFDTRYVPDNFTFVDVSHPVTDAQSFSIGDVVGQIGYKRFFDNGSMEGVDPHCEGPECAYYQTILTMGALQVGSSGSGLIHEELQRVLAVLSSGDPENDCAGAENSFAKLSNAWPKGMYELWPDSSPDEPIMTDYEHYDAPIPTITVGNIVPDITPKTGPANISIQLQQAPPKTVTISLALDRGAPVLLSKHTLVFGPSNWSEPQYVSLTADEDAVPIEESAAEFSLLVRWPAVWSNGTWVQRRKNIRGTLRPNIRGTSLANPIRIPDELWTGEYPFEVFNPQLPLIAENEGPFIPAIYLSYKRTNIEALRVLICPTSGNLVNETKLGVSTYGPNYLLEGELLLPQLTLATNDGSGCTGAMLFFPSNTTYRIAMHAATTWTLPGFTPDLYGDVEVEAHHVVLSQAVDMLLKYTGVKILSPLGFHQLVKFTPENSIFVFKSPITAEFDFNTCYNDTTVATGITIWDPEVLEPLLTTGIQTDYCVEALGVTLEADKLYIVVIGTRRPVGAWRSVRPEFDFTVSVSDPAAWDA